MKGNTGPYKKNQFIRVWYIFFLWPDVWRVVDLIILIVSEDEGRHRHVSNVICDPSHPGHHLVHLAEESTLSEEFYGTVYSYFI